MQPLLGSGVVNTCLQQWLNMQQQRNCWKQCFLIRSQYVDQSDSTVQQTDNPACNWTGSALTFQDMKYYLFSFETVGRFHLGTKMWRFFTGMPSYSWWTHSWNDHSLLNSWIRMLKRYMYLLIMVLSFFSLHLLHCHLRC
jgi:hypothetical protein